jgi:ABC-type transport system substrate-binding protein
MKRPGQLIAVSLVTLGIVAAACGGDNSSSSPTTTGGGTATTAGSATTGGGGTATTTATTAAATTTTAAAKPTPGGKITVRVEAEVGNPWVPANLNCDTACHTRARTFFEPLMAIDATDGKPKPYLAQDVTHSADYQTWTVKLRPNITFTDGTPLNADAVTDNLERCGSLRSLGPRSRTSPA